MNSKHFLLLPAAALLLSGLTVSPARAQALPDKPVVTGTFLGDGKDAKIQHLVVQTRESFSDKAAIRLVFTEKDPSKSKKPDFDAGFKKLGSALILSVFRDGGIFGCEVAHSVHPKSPFSAVGQIKMKEFKVTDTHVSGQVSTGGELDAFGQKWNVELTFSAPLPKGAFAEASDPAPEPKKPGKTKEETEPVATGPKMPVSELPLPATARDVEYKAVVQQIAFSADASVSTVSNDFSARLKQQGWKESAGSLKGKNNAMLKCKLNGAELTAMIQPAGKNCTVKVFTQGLDWSNPPASTTAAKPVKSTDIDLDGVEAEAQKALNDALKLIPRGLK